MADQWHVGRHGRVEGPFSPDQMRQMVVEGRIVPTDLVWKEGMAGWLPATQVPGLIPSAGAGGRTSAVSPPSTRRVGAPPPISQRTAAASVVPVPVSVGIGGEDPSQPHATRPIETGYSFAAAFSLANQAFMSKWSGLAMIGLVMFGFVVVLGLPGAVLNGIGAASGNEQFAGIMAATGQCIGQLLGLLVGGPFFAGVVLAGANALSGTPQVSDLMLGFKRYGQVLLASFLTYLCSIGVVIVSFLPMLLFAVVAGLIGAGGREGAGLATVVAGVGMIVTFVMMLVGFGLVVCRLMFAPAIVADSTLGSIHAMDAMRRSWSTTSPMIGLSVMGLMVVAGIIAGFSVLLLCVGYVVVGLPVLAVLPGAAYTLLFRSSEPATFLE